MLPSNQSLEFLKGIFLDGFLLGSLNNPRLQLASLVPSHRRTLLYSPLTYYDSNPSNLSGTTRNPINLGLDSVNIAKAPSFSEA